MERKHVIMLIAVIIIVILPLALFNGKGEAQGFFTGSDDQGPAAIEQQGYHPWFKPLWTPPSSEIETLIFSIQAAIGAGIIGYFLGYYKARAKNNAIDEIRTKENEK